MNKEEILKKARNNGYDEREQSIHTKSSAIAKAIGVSLGFIIAFVELVFLERAPVATISAFAVCFTMDAFESWYRFANLKGKFNLIKAILYSTFAVAFIICLARFFYMGY